MPTENDGPLLQAVSTSDAAPPMTCGEEDRCSLPGDIAVVACHFNPCGFRRPRANVDRFLAALRRTGIAPYLAELAFDDAPFDLPDSDRILRFRTKHVLWHKERLINLLVASLPEDVDKVVWVDADLLFERPDWLEQTARLLERYPIVQPFDRAVFLDAGDRPVEGIFGLVRGVAAYGRNVSFARFHPGFAWAARREFFRRFGLFDRDVCGGGDSSFVTGAFGRRDTRIERLQGPLQTRAMTKWAGGALDYLRGRAACTPGAVAHLWHGNREQRNYRKRRICLGDFAFDPQVHLKAGLSGLFEWSESSDPRLIAAVRQYFFDRKEDG